ncbi:hypothetical protein HYH03_001732 [Edaphochlamys debaryana]|uniref:Uncharacterized protein n=1 Tax=Edaphochlamys debaryana TaxID=47281 RepID=A0A835YKB2_9CHLO|nr:hypothetical protein HYH03_001732 [Edaphochlamys debaryana]|eukprot:KAG2500150.1 hypothetical protein HYH03_001732 [Edaphochlamys debaryana]
MSNLQQQQRKQHDLERLRSALEQLSVPLPTAAALHPGPERLNLITLLLERLTTPAVLEAAMARVQDLPIGLADEELHAHRLARAMQALDIHVSGEQVRGCTTLEDSVRVLSILANQVAATLAVRTAAAASSSAGPTASTSQPTAGSSGASAAASSPAPAAYRSPGPSTAPSPTPRQRTPSRAGYGGSGDGAGPSGAQGGGGGARLGLVCLEAEMRFVDMLAERAPALLDAGGGGNLFPADIVAAMQPYMPSQPLPEVAADLERRTGALGAGLRSLAAEEAQLAAEVCLVDEAEWRQVAEATRSGLEALLDSSQAFYTTFQTGLGVWCAKTQAAPTCGLGPLAAELLQRYGAVRQLAADLAKVRKAYGSIVSYAPPLTLLEPHALTAAVRAGQAAVEAVRGRTALAQRVLAQAGPERAAALEAVRAVHGAA